MEIPFQFEHPSIAENTTPQNSNLLAYHQEYTASSQNPNAQFHPLMNKNHVPVFCFNPQTLRPRGFGPTSSSIGIVHEAYDANMLHALSAYYLDPSVASFLKTWALEMLCYYESFPNPTGAIVPPINLALMPLENSTKETTVSQFVWCDVCMVECNTKEFLDKHKMGKKHGKYEEKMKKSITPPPPTASGVSVNPLIEPQENPASFAVQKTRKKAADLETKARKLMEKGAAPVAIRVCAICNVVFNSYLVFAHHIVGKKHVLKLLVIGTSVVVAT